MHPPFDLFVQTTKVLYQGFPWNDRKRHDGKQSNCFMVPAKQQPTPQPCREREIKLKVSKERYNVSEKQRLTDVENQMLVLQTAM